MFQQNCTIDNVPKLIKSIGGKFFSVCFVKRTNGEVRTMNCRKGVLKHLKGGTLGYDPQEHGLLSVYSIDASGYRMVDMRTLKWIRYGGEEFKITYP